ncbi:MAG: fructosamine kinase family protein [SAR324 cluster bacterium]|nr:fructosamine kinase family protein [SAR324 cluster bacterium]
MNADLRLRLEKTLAEPVKSTTAVSGGCIADSRKLQMISGKEYFIKQALDGNCELFESEVLGLEELRKCSAINVPEVIAHDTDFLLLEWINEGQNSTDSDMETFGFQFAELHRNYSEKFGCTDDNFIGDSLQLNQASTAGSDNWAVFFAENRLQYQAELTENNGYSTPELRNLLDRIIEKIPDLVSGTEEKPSLLHGDLWCGNYLIDLEGSAWLIDPAVYYGHREADLAMTYLFGGFSEIFYSAYESAFPLVPGFYERKPLYQLYHLLNHLNLFGTGYYAQVISILKRYVG